jgi:excisionase family DNA binding protein
MSFQGKAVKTAPTPPEPFVSVDEAARFLGVKRRFVLELARNGMNGAYGLGTGTIRKVWVFRLSELATAIAARNTDPKKLKLCDPSPGSRR